MRLLTTSIILTVVLCLPFLIWGDEFMQWFTSDAAIHFPEAGYQWALNDESSQGVLCGLEFLTIDF